jgi:hypothetical protein
MPIDLMPEKTQNRVLSLQQLIQQHIHVEGKSGDLEPFIVLTGALAELIEMTWSRFQDQLREGMDEEAARTGGASLSIAADLWLEAAQALRESGRPGGPVAGLSELTSASESVEEIRATARKVVDSVNAASAAPLDPDLLAKSEADFAAGRVQKGGNVIARLRSAK